MSSDPATCTSEHVTFSQFVQSVKHGDRYENAPALEMDCPDCNRWACVALDGSPFPEPFVAKSWNAHHARQMAARIEQLQREATT